MIVLCRLAFSINARKIKMVGEGVMSVHIGMSLASFIFFFWGGVGVGGGMERCRGRSS